MSVKCWLIMLHDICKMSFSFPYLDALCERVFVVYRLCGLTRERGDMDAYVVP